MCGQQMVRPETGLMGKLFETHVCAASLRESASFGSAPVKIKQILHIQIGHSNHT